MWKPWREPYLGLGYYHPARKYYRETHNGVDPWFAGAEAYRIGSQICLFSFGVILWASSFLVSITPFILAGIVFVCLLWFTAVVYMRDKTFERAIREAEGFLRLTDEEQFATMGWGALQRMAQDELENRIHLWRRLMHSCTGLHPAHRWVDGLEQTRQDIRRQYYLLIYLGLLVPQVSLGEDAGPSDCIMVVRDTPRSTLAE